MSSAVTYHRSSFARDAAAGARLILASGFQPDYVREVANAHARLGCDVELIGGDMHAGQRYEDGVTFHNVRGSDRRDRNHFRELIKLARYYARLLAVVAASPSPVMYDISIGRPFLRCALMYPLFRMLGKRIVYTAHNVLPHDGDNLRNRIVYWTIYRTLVDAIVVHGQALKERLIEEFGVQPDLVYVAPHGTYHPVTTPDMSRAVARAALNIPSEQRVLLAFGLQRHYKGTHFAIDALEAYGFDNLTLLVRGHAPDSSYQRLLEEQARQFSGDTRLDLRFGTVDDFEMELLFNAADIVLLPYLEGSQSGIKFMAYAYGRPVLASDCGSLPEHVVPGVTGEVFRAGDQLSFAQTLDRMLGALDQYSQEAIAAYAHEHCSFDAAAKYVHALCANVCEVGRGTP